MVSMENELQRLVDALFRDSKRVGHLDVLMLADAFDLSPEPREIVNAVPPGTYTRAQLTTQMNSSIAAHGWRIVCGMVD